MDDEENPGTVDESDGGINYDDDLTTNDKEN